MSGFYKMDPSAWDFGTANLSLEEEAAYLRIVNAIHKHDAPVPNNDRVLAGLFRCSTRKARALVDALVSAGKVTVEDGVIWNERAREDMTRRGIASASAAERGAKGGKARAEKQAASAQFATISPPVHDHFVTISTPEVVTNSARTTNEPSAKALKCNNAIQATASSRIEENRIEEIEEKEEPIGSSQKTADLGLNKPPKPPPKHRASSLPEGWVPSEKNLADAMGRNFTDAEIADEADRFRDYHLAKGSTFKCWDAAWRTWLANARKFGHRGMAGGQASAGRGQPVSLAGIAARRRASAGY